MTTLRRQLACLLLLATSLLGGCSLPRMIDSNVESFVGSEGALTGVGFRFERLPSQQQRSQQQEALERMADEALQDVGLRHDDTTPRYSAQVELSVQTIVPPFQPRFRAERPLFGPDGGGLPPSSFSLMLEPPWFSHTVRVVLRDLDTARVAFESSASFDGPWSDSTRLVPVILRAALRDYPHPPAGLRKVVIELPADTAPAQEP